MIKKLIQKLKGAKHMNIDIDYAKLAKAIAEYQKKEEHDLMEEIKTPIGVVTDPEALERIKDLAKLERGLELVLMDVMKQKAEIHYQRLAWWDHHVYHAMSMDRSAKYRVDEDTGEVFKLAYGYEDIMRGLEYEKIREELTK